jgi:hypothetical protein
MAADFTQFPIETATITERVASNPATLPLAGTEGLLIDQGGTTKGATAAAIAATLPEATTTAAGKLSAGDKTKLDSIASNATANASDAELRDRATHTGEQAISTVTGLQTALDGKATSAQGALAESAIQPGNSALSDSREWSAATVTEEEAADGTATTRRAWTAQRVRQAIAAWWTGASTAEGRAMVEAVSAAAQQTLLGLGAGDSPTFTGLTISGTGPVVIPHIHGSIAGNFYVHVRNTSGGSLPAGTAVYVVGNVGDTDRRQVAACDPTDPLKMPAIAVLEAALANNADGDAINIGELRPINTSGLTQSALLYVGAGGVLTATEPTSGIVQSVATVARVNAQTGVLAIQIGDRLGTAALSPASDFALASQGVTNGNSHDHADGDGAQIAYSSLSGLPSLTDIATATPAGGLSIQNGNLVPPETIKLIVSDLGETGIATGNSKSEVRIDRAFVVLGVWWNCHPSAMASAGTSEARPYIRTGAGTTSAGTKTNLLTSAGNIASLAASVHTVDATSLISGGTYSGSAGDWLGVDIMSVGTGSSGHQLTYLLRYS